MLKNYLFKAPKLYLFVVYFTLSLFCKDGTFHQPNLQNLIEFTMLLVSSKVDLSDLLLFC